MFCQLGYFKRLIMISWKDEVAQNNGDFLGYFLLKPIYYIFTWISSFITWFVVGILRFQKWFDVDVLGCQIELSCRFFWPFLIWQLFGLFFEKFGNFFSNLLVTLGLVALRCQGITRRWSLLKFANCRPNLCILR